MGYGGVGGVMYVIGRTTLYFARCIVHHLLVVLFTICSLYFSADWTRPTQLLRAPSSDTFFATLRLAPSLYQYKYIVDGKWLVSPLDVTADDGTGNINNLLRLEPSPRAFEDE